MLGNKILLALLDKRIDVVNAIRSELEYDSRDV